MSVKAVAKAKETYVGRAAAKLLLIILADYERGDGVAWAPVSRLMEQGEMSERSVQRNVRYLEERGLVRSEPVFEDSGRQIRNDYRLLFMAESASEEAPKEPRQIDGGEGDRLTPRGATGDGGGGVTGAAPGGVTGDGVQEELQEELQEERLPTTSVEVGAGVENFDAKSALERSQPLIAEYLNTRVDPELHLAWLRSLESWFNGLDESVWRRPDTGRTIDPVERPLILQRALLDLLQTDETELKGKPGQIRNLRTKVTAKLGEEFRFRECRAARAEQRGIEIQRSGGHREANSNRQVERLGDLIDPEIDRLAEQAHLEDEWFGDLHASDRKKLQDRISAELEARYGRGDPPKFAREVVRRGVIGEAMAKAKEAA